MAPEPPTPTAYHSRTPLPSKAGKNEAAEDDDRFRTPTTEKRRLNSTPMTCPPAPVKIKPPTNPFAEASSDNAGAVSKEYVHVRVQQRNGRKSLTTVHGLKKEDINTKILKDLKKKFRCDVTVVVDPELGQVIQLHGDHRKNVSTFLDQAGIVKEEQIKIHHF